MCYTVGSTSYNVGVHLYGLTVRTDFITRCWWRGGSTLEASFLSPSGSKKPGSVRDVHASVVLTDIKGFLEDVDWLYLSICVIYRRFESVNFENIERHLS